MKKSTWNNRIKRKFRLPENAKIVYYRNPDEFRRLELERINPNHKMVIWGVLRNKNKLDARIRVGRINIPYTILTLFAYALNPYYGFILANILLSFWISFLVFAIPICGIKKSLKYIFSLVSSKTICYYNYSG